MPNKGAIRYIQPAKGFHNTNESGFVLDRIVSIQRAVELISNAQVEEVETATTIAFAVHVEGQGLDDGVI